MTIEIEKKFLVTRFPETGLGKKHRIRQGYIWKSVRGAVRVRKKDDSGFLAVKGPTQGGVRQEFEYEIPARDADRMLDLLCGKPLVIKIRQEVAFKGHLWVVDTFLEENQGLILAEIELPSPSAVFPIPDWIGKEVTEEPGYLNCNLVKRPFSTWKDRS